MTTIGWNVAEHGFSLAKGLALCGLAAGIAVAISRFTSVSSAAPLKLLEAASLSHVPGRPEPFR